jgi:hypothetical protein
MSWPWNLALTFTSTLSTAQAISERESSLGLSNKSQLEDGGFEQGPRMGIAKWETLHLKAGYMATLLTHCLGGFSVYRKVEDGPLAPGT